MAKRKTKRASKRRSNGLGSSTTTHRRATVRSSMELALVAHDVIKDANAKRCTAAFKKLLLAHEASGDAAAHGMASKTRRVSPDRDKAEGALFRAHDAFNRACKITKR